MLYPVRIIHSLRVLVRRLSQKGLEKFPPVVEATVIAKQLIDEVMTGAGYYKEPVQWNPAEYEVTKPKEWFDEGFKELHPAVRGTGYEEVHDLIGTSGCSPEKPYWVWTVMGVVETERGKLVVCPNDWILEPIEGVFIVMPDSVYREFNKELQ